MKDVEIAEEMRIVPSEVDAAAAASNSSATDLQNKLSAPVRHFPFLFCLRNEKDVVETGGRGIVVFVR